MSANKRRGVRELVHIDAIAGTEPEQTGKVVRDEGDHAERGDGGDHMRQDEDPEKDEEAEPVGHDPAIAEDKTGGDAEAHANEPGHGRKHEIPEEEAEEHEDRPEKHVEQKLVAWPSSPVQPVALERHVGRTPRRRG